MNDLISELAMKEKYITKLKDDNKLLSKKISDKIVEQLETVETKADKVHTRLKNCVYNPSIN